MATRLQNIAYTVLVATAGLLVSANTAAQLIPVGDVSSSNWTPEALTPNLEADDIMIISSPLASHATGEVMMSDDIEPGLYTLFTVRVLARKFPAGSAQNLANRGLEIDVRINGVLLGEQDVIDLTDEFTFYSFVFTGSFTHDDLATLQVLFATNGRVNGANLRRVDINYIEVVLPDPAPLPVKLKSFNANRKQARVELNWVTALEQNNSGFEIQRNTGAGGWQIIEFIRSQSADGNSSAELSYHYVDANDARGVTQYRLKQIDFDNKFEYSAIRAVHGMSQSGRTLIIPNPSANGTLNILFESPANRDLQLTDMVGRVVRKWNNYADNSLHVSSLLPGSYFLRVVEREANLIQVERIIVVK